MPIFFFSKKQVAYRKGRLNDHSVFRMVHSLFHRVGTLWVGFYLLSGSEADERENTKLRTDVKSKPGL